MGKSVVSTSILKDLVLDLMPSMQLKSADNLRTFNRNHIRKLNVAVQPEATMKCRNLGDLAAVVLRLKHAFIACTIVGPMLASPVTATAKNNDSDGVFRLGTLPKGKNVTIPRPATTQIPVASRVVLTPTDMPQSISMKPVNVTNGPTGMLRVAIYDQNSDRVKYVELSPTTSFVYQVKNLRPITVIPEERGGATASLVLQVQSDKPLQIAH